jgi:hypothetical protein
MPGDYSCVFTEAKKVFLQMCFALTDGNEGMSLRSTVRLVTSVTRVEENLLFGKNNYKVR